VKPAPFEYHRPESLDEAAHIMARHAGDARALAGGQSLLPLLFTRALRPAHLVDLQRVPEMHGVVVEEGRLRIGAMVRQRDLEHDDRVPGLVRAAIPHIGHFQIRNRGTVGGSLAHMDPAAEWPALALVLGAVMVAASARGRRTIAAEEFMVGPQQTVLASDELLVYIEMPAEDQAFGFAEVTRRGLGDFALAGAACHGNTVAVFGVGPRPQRLTTVEDLLERGGWSSSVEVEAVAAAEIHATDDLHASAEYRRHAAASLVGTAVRQARSRR
jgi:carbon-monoxide dehydrogenase medium subunit